MANLHFHPPELLQELASLQTLAGRFLDATSPFQLIELTKKIEGLVAAGGSIRLEIPEARPLKTRVSHGEFEPAGKSSSRRVYGTISGVWDVELCEVKVLNPARPGKKPSNIEVIGFTGLSSAVFRVRDESDGRVIACWKMDHGDANAPGCFFHTHTFGSEDQALPVPRHPNVFATPMAAIEFAIGELFQDSWEEAVSGSTDAPQRWRAIQRKRLKALLSWQIDLVGRTMSSPWCSMKLTKPDPALFL